MDLCSAVCKTYSYFSVFFPLRCIWTEGAAPNSDMCQLCLYTDIDLHENRGSRLSIAQPKRFFEYRGNNHTDTQSCWDIFCKVAMIYFTSLYKRLLTTALWKEPETCMHFCQLLINIFLNKETNVFRNWDSFFLDVIEKEFRDGNK